MPQIKPQLTAWIRAYRPLAFVNIQVPLLFGAALGGFAGRPECLLFMVYGFFLQGFIVFWNDAADAHADAVQDRPTVFSGGSRVIPDGLLTRSRLMTAGWVMLAGVLGSTAVHGWLYRAAWWQSLPALLGPLMLWMYSFPPARLNYRGGGELLQAVGCGLVLPCLGMDIALKHLVFADGLHYAHAVGLTQKWSIPVRFSWFLVAAYFLLQAAAALAVTLPDAGADRKAGKNTLAVLAGAHRARWLVVLLVALAGLCLVRVVVHAQIANPAELPAFAGLAWLVLVIGLMALARRQLAFIAVTLMLPVLCALPFILPKVCWWR